MTIMTIEDSDGNVYSFPESFFLIDDPFSLRTSIKDLIYAHGGRQTADGFVNTRQITIVGTLLRDTDALFETEYRALLKAILKGGKLRISPDVVNRFMQVSRPDVDSSWIHPMNYKKLDISFKLEFPFWQDYTENVYTKVTAGNDLLTIDASASDEIIMPIIEITADQSANIPGIKIRNASDGGMTFEYNNVLFTAGAVLTIDSSQGTIALNGNDAISSFVSGAFLRLQPKSNSIYYEGNACTIRVKYRKVYL